jgi:hypothetical protein
MPTTLLLLVVVVVLYGLVAGVLVDIELLLHL